MERVAFYWKGTPIPKKRPRVTRYSTHMPQNYLNYKDDVSTCYFEAQLKREIPKKMFLLPIRIEIYFWMPIPKSSSKRVRKATEGRWCTKLTGDMDNLIGGVMDALNNVAWADDSQIVSVTASKKYELEGYPAGFYLVIEEVEDA
jgi:Holliday junction resolvase RusA-like endonuclease